MKLCCRNNKSEILKMDKYIYSIIIPHKNAPELLLQCIASIPPRDDVQIIVVDDNSDEGVVNWESFTSDKSKNLELILTKEGKGAGYARNVGLKHAQGKWVLFADCDDYYCNGFLDVLDRYKEQEADVVYYSFFNIDDKGKKKKNELIEKALKSQKQELIDSIKYRQLFPWNKMTNRKFLVNKGILFEQCVNGNDLFFSYQVGYSCHVALFEPTPLYCYVKNKNSLTHKKKNNDLFYHCILGHRLKSNSFYQYLGYSKWKKSINRVFLSFLCKRGILSFIQAFKVYVINYKQLHKDQNEFVEYFESIQSN